MERLRSILRRPHCRLTCGDYAPLIETPGDDVFLFLDPPYLMNHHGSPIYEEYMSEQEHVVFAEKLRACSHKWLLTIGNCRLSRDLYRGFRILVRQYTGSLPHRAPDRNKTELIVMNY
jgi:DNA adenine methylase